MGYHFGMKTSADQDDEVEVNELNEGPLAVKRVQLACSGRYEGSTGTANLDREEAIAVAAALLAAFGLSFRDADGLLNYR